MERTGLVTLLSHGTSEVVHFALICLIHMPLNFVSGIVLGPYAKSFQFNTGQFQYYLHVFHVPLTQTHGNSRPILWFGFHLKLYAPATSYLQCLSVEVNGSMLYECLFHRNEFINLCWVGRSQEDPKDHTQNH
jgi:hypothetical protein